MISYKNKLLLDGYTDEEIKDKLEELDEVTPIEIDSWNELDGVIINGFRFGLAGQRKNMLNVSKIINGKERNYGVFNLEINPTFAIESYLMVLNIFIMMMDKGRVYSSDEVC